MASCGKPASAENQCGSRSFEFVKCNSRSNNHKEFLHSDACFIVITTVVSITLSCGEELGLTKLCYVALLSVCHLGDVLR